MKERAMRDILLGYGMAFIALLCFVLYLIGFIDDIRFIRSRKKLYDKMKETVNFGHGLFCGDYETQANSKGYTLGEKAEHFARTRAALFRLRMNGYISESEMGKITMRIQKDLFNRLKKKEERK